MHGTRPAGLHFAIDVDETHPGGCTLAPGDVARRRQPFTVETDDAHALRRLARPAPQKLGGGVARGVIDDQDRRAERRRLGQQGAQAPVDVRRPIAHADADGEVHARLLARPTHEFVICRTFGALATRTHE
jgi:hypothetical protein